MIPATDADVKTAVVAVKAEYLRLQMAKKNYRDALVIAIAKGASNSQVARACGISEAAIRLFRKRNGL